MKSDWRAWRSDPDRAGPGFFPPELVVQVKALACELPAKHQLPLSRWSLSDLNAQIRQSGLVASISDTTIWRWLHADAIRPWQHRCWVFPRDPHFLVKAAPILDLYHRVWKRKPLHDDDFVISADEKTSIQARRRLRPTVPTKPGSPMKVEHEYQRCGAWAYLAALDVHRAKVFGRCEPHNGMAPFDRLVDQVMTRPPYSDARRVFWIVDNCSSHRGLAAVQRLQKKHPRLVLLHLPVHASWLNQIEIYFSIVQRKVLAPNDFPDLHVLAERLIRFQDYWHSLAQPFQWNFSRRDLTRLLAKCNLYSQVAA